MTDLGRTDVATPCGPLGGLFEFSVRAIGEYHIHAELYMANINR